MLNLKENAKTRIETTFVLSIHNRSGYRNYMAHIDRLTLCKDNYILDMEGHLQFPQ